MKSLKDISKILQDYERRLIALEGKKKTVHSKQYRFKSGSTADKIVKLISEGFFNKHRSIKDIIVKLKEKDFHLQP